MRGYNVDDNWIYTHRWTLFFLSLSVIFAIPMLLIVSTQLCHAAGLYGLEDLTSNMNGSTAGQNAAMGSTGASAVAGGAAAGSSSGKGRKSSSDDELVDIPPLVPNKPDAGTEDPGTKSTGKKLKDSDVTPLDPKTSKPMHCDEDGDCTGGPQKGSSPRGNKGGSSDTGSGSGGSSGKGADDSGFLPGWLTDLLN